MMRRLNRIFMVALLMAFGMGVQSCLDLEEQTFDILDAGLYYRDEASVQGIVGRIYTQNDDTEESFFELSELASDVTTWRTWNAGNWGWDEGARFFVQTQQWTPATVRVRNAWDDGFVTIGFANNALDDFARLSPAEVGLTRDELDAYIAEVRTLRAWVYYRMFEVYGGMLPLVTTVDPNLLPPSAGDGDLAAGNLAIFNFLIEELDETVADLPQNESNRMNQAVNRILKARLLLNAELFIGQDRYAECEALSQDILDGDFGTYSLATDYRENLDVNNQDSPEVIHATAWSNNFYHNENYRVAPYIPSNVVRNYFGEERPLQFSNFWNCWILMPSKDNSGNILDGETPDSFLFDYGDKLGAIMDKWHDDDVRKQNFVYDMDAGEFRGQILEGEMYENFGQGDQINGDADRNGQLLVFVDQVGTFQNLGKDLQTVMSPRWGETNSGIRLIKYPVFPGESGINTQEPDNVYFRLAEVYYMLAECKLRDGDPDGAKDLVNAVRERYFDPADWTAAQDEFPGFDAIDLDWMLSEWGMEFMAEGQRRRTDLRRYDKFTQGQWWFFGRAENEGGGIIPATRDRRLEWYPVPDISLLGNRNLSQNPNYISE